jgi:hypothetical protein
MEIRKVDKGKNCFHLLLMGLLHVSLKHEIGVNVPPKHDTLLWLSLPKNITNRDPKCGKNKSDPVLN